MTKSVKINNIEAANETLITYFNNGTRYAIVEKQYGFAEYNPDTMDTVPSDYYQICCGSPMMPSDWTSKKFYTLSELENEMRTIQSDLRKWSYHIYD
jgi:hypothetical protein